MKTQRCSEES